MVTPTHDSREPDSLARIPFSKHDELMIASLAKWMNFMGWFQMFAGVAMLLLLVAVATVAGHIVPKSLKAQSGTLGLLGLLLAGLAVVIIWGGSLLTAAADRFKLVALTDEADQDFLATGFGKLKTFFLIEVATGFITIAVTVMQFIYGKGGA